MSGRDHIETLPKSDYRKLVEAQHPGVNELEAIAYARGVTRGLAYMRLSKGDMEVELLAMRLTDPLLHAGMAFMGLNKVEALVAEKEGKVN